MAGQRVEVEASTEKSNLLGNKLLALARSILEANGHRLTISPTSSQPASLRLPLVVCFASTSNVVSEASLFIYFSLCLSLPLLQLAIEATSAAAALII